VGDLTHGLLATALAVKLHAELRRPDQARHQLYGALDLLAALDAALPHELPDPLNAPAPAVPVNTEESHP
jgi:hypothetical protein